MAGRAISGITGQSFSGFIAWVFVSAGLIWNMKPFFSSRTRIASPSGYEKVGKSSWECADTLFVIGVYGIATAKIVALKIKDLAYSSACLYGAQAPKSAIFVLIPAWNRYGGDVCFAVDRIRAHLSPLVIEDLSALFTKDQGGVADQTDCIVLLCCEL